VHRNTSAPLGVGAAGGDARLEAFAGGARATDPAAIGSAVRTWQGLGTSRRPDFSRASSRKALALKYFEIANDFMAMFHEARPATEMRDDQANKPRQ